METADSAQQRASGLQRMTEHVQTYHSLQSLLFFQTLAAHRPESNAFSETAHFLKNSALFKNGISGSDDEALTPEHLQQLFEKIIKGISSDDSNAKSSPEPTSCSDESSNARKESAPALQAAELIPSLYEDYKRRIIDDIRAEERKYDQLMGEMTSIQESPSVEAHVQKEDQTNHEPAGVVIEEVKAQDKGDQRPDQALPIRDSTSAEKADSKLAVEEKSTAQESKRPRRHNASIDSIINHDEPKEEKLIRPSTAGSNAAPPPPFPRESPYAPSTNQHPPTSAPLRAQSPPPTRRDSQRPPELRQVSSPRSGPPLPNLSSHSPNAPVILPPPPGMNMNPPPIPPTSPYSPSSDLPAASTFRQHAPPYGSSSYPSQEPYASLSRYSEAYVSPTPRAVRRPSPSNHSTARQNFQPYSPQTPSYTSPTHQYGHRGGVMLPPFQEAPQGPGASQSSQTSGPYAAPVKPKTVPDKLPFQQGGGIGTPVRTPTSVSQPSPFSGPNTAHLRKPGIVVSPGSSTGWKLISDAPEIERPRPRSISPISDRDETPVPAKHSAQRQRKGRPPKSQEQKKMPKRTPSSPPRSQSVSSQLSEAVAPSRAGKVARKLKQERPATPLATSADEDELAPPMTVKPVKRLQPGKRKRDGSSVATPPRSVQSVQPVEQTRGDTIIAYRNFGRMAQPVLNIIQSHKHAAMFAEPIRERQVEGYYEVVKRPQNLKSIRAAIAAGTRAVTAAVESQQTSPGSTAGSTSSSSSNTITLPVSELLVPPKGIVNAEQLEQEVMRMFANAVMFNAGNDEIVEDTREMFKSVEQALQQWRDVERMDEAEEVTKEEDTTASSTKRRRL